LDQTRIYALSYRPTTYWHTLTDADADGDEYTDGYAERPDFRDLDSSESSDQEAEGAPVGELLDIGTSAKRAAKTKAAQEKCVKSEGHAEYLAASERDRAERSALASFGLGVSIRKLKELQRSESLEDRDKAAARAPRKQRKRKRAPTTLVSRVVEAIAAADKSVAGMLLELEKAELEHRKSRAQWPAPALTILPSRSWRACATDRRNIFRRPT